MILGSTVLLAQVRDLPSDRPHHQPTVRGTYTRRYPNVIKGTFNPGRDQIDQLLSTDLQQARATGFNTVYVYVNHQYDNRVMKVVSPVGGPHFSATAKDEYLQMIKDIKSGGFAIYLTLEFGGGRPSPFGVSRAQYLADTKRAAIAWAKIGEELQVEFFGPASELDWHLNREYLGNDWRKNDAALAIGTRFHREILPEIKKVFTGKTVYQYGYATRTPVRVPGYDLIGVDFNFSGKSLPDFRTYVRDVYATTAAGARQSNTEWFVAEYWTRYRDFPKEGGGAGPVLKNAKGQSMDTLQDDYLKIATEEYLRFSGKKKPQGFGIMSYHAPIAAVINRPAEGVLKAFFRKI